MRFKKTLEIINIILLLVLLSTILIEVIGRALKIPTPWTEDVAETCFAWVIWLGSVFATKDFSHTSLFSSKKRWLQLIGAGTIIVFLLIILILGLKQLHLCLIYWRLTPGARIPVFIIRVVLYLGALINLIYGFQVFLKMFKGGEQL